MTQLQHDDYAYGLLARALAQVAYSWTPGGEAEWAKSITSEVDAGKVVFYHEFLSNLENIADALSKLGILKEVKGSYCVFTFEVDIAMVSAVAIKHREMGPDFQHMLHYFCYHFSDYGTDYYGLNFHIDTPFCPQHGMSELLEALAELGYAYKLGVGSVVQINNPNLSSGWDENLTILLKHDHDGLGAFRTIRRPKRMRFIRGEGSPCFLWTKRMRAIAADGIVWDELAGFDYEEE
ncbi:hypothetical protein [Rhizobium sp. AC27/96]|uniref:hypothetical protein n=1 Tax=Rhizobium sp. AC27/96 TaxID=1841653 RepID=UPI001146291D|nr:hypothetical protein [Rhizobium sp. AC27/96]